MIVKRPSADSKPQSAIREPQSSDAILQSANQNPQSAIRNPQSLDAILQSANQNPQSAIRNPQSSVEPAARMLAERFGAFPAIAIVAGSGLGAIAERVRNAVSISYSQLPGFPVSDVAGHAGKIVVGDLAGRRVAIFCGRKHLYESITTDEATFAVRLMATAGVRRLILSNAAGGVSQRMFPGDLMLIRDHVNICHRKFVRFLKAPLGAPLGAPASLPACRQYSNHHSPAEMPALPVEAARREKIPLKEGVYCIMSGPAYETSAEVRLARLAGADAVGMSTVPEAIEAARQGIETLAISCITNSHVHSKGKTTHAEVIEVARRVERNFIRLITAIIRDLPAK